MTSKRDPKGVPLTRCNPVAKYAPQANNRAVAFRDRTAYVRKAKHKGRESCPTGSRRSRSARALGRGAGSTPSLCSCPVAASAVGTS